MSESPLRSALQRDGAVCVRQAFTSDWIAEAATAIDAVLATPSPLAVRASDAADGAFIEDFRNWRRIPQIEALARHSPAASIAAELLDATTIRLFHDHVLVKEAGTSQRTRWHQDLPYYDIEGSQHVSMWLPVDPVPRASSLEFIAGSHLGPRYLPRTFLSGDARWFPEGSLTEMPDFDAELDHHEVIGWALEPGDAVFFDMLAVHGAGGFPGPGRRRVLSLRFIGDDIVHAARPWRTSPPFDDVDLVDGGPMDAEEFPVLHRR